MTVVANPGRRPHDPELPERARAMRAEGKLYREIVEELGVPRSTVAQWITDPDGTHNRERREKYTGTCIDCGGRTSWCADGGLPAIRCAVCTHIHNKKWTPGRVIEAIQEWASRYGKPPSAMEWNTGHRYCAREKRALGDYPGMNTLQHVFGSWNAAIEAAGFEPRKPYGGPPGSLSKEELERTVALYQELGSLNAVARVVGISGQGVRVRLGYAGVLPKREENHMAYKASEAIDRDIERTKEQIDRLRTEIEEREQYLVALERAQTALKGGAQIKAA